MIMQDVRRHKLDYSILAFLSLAFAIYFVLSRHTPKLLFAATLGFATLYFVWGIWHHSRSHHVTAKIVLEYLLVAALGVTLVSSLLL